MAKSIFSTYFGRLNSMYSVRTTLQPVIDSARFYAIKSDLPITWIRPEKISCIDPKKSGDLEPVKEIDTKGLIALNFKDAEELKTVDEEVKKLFTLEFLPRKETVKYLKQDYVNSVKRNEFDSQSPEAKVASMTAHIRELQKVMEKNRTDMKTKVVLKEIIDKRKKLLREIRISDYKLYEWLLEKLNLVYKPQPPSDMYLQVERKRSMRVLTQEYCDNIIRERREEVKKKLIPEQGEFLKEKIRTLEWIIKEEAACQVAPTVTEQDVENAKLQFEDWKRKHGSKSENIINVKRT